MKVWCEFVVKEFLPFARSTIARILVNKYRLSQKEVAKVLNTTQPAISQYLKGKRGKNTKLIDKEIIYQIENVCKELIESNKKFEEIIPNLCKIAREHYGVEKCVFLN